MSKESVQKFYELLMTDPVVAEELKKIAAGRDIADPEKAAVLVVDFAAKKGFDFTTRELARFEQENQRELTPEELEKINAAGAGGYCALIGLGWNNAYGIGITKCSIIGIGLGITWKDATDPANKDEAEIAKKIVETIGKSGARITGGTL